MFLRRHWIVPLQILLAGFFLLFIPVLIYMGVSRSDMLQGEIYYAIFVLLSSAYYLFIVLFTFTNFIDYYLDVWIVTNMRIINIEQKGLFSRVISEKDLDIMQDVTSDISGFLPTLLEYGDVFIQTAAETERFIFKQVPFAGEVSRRISNLVSEYKKMNKAIEPEV